MQNVKFTVNQDEGTPIVVGADNKSLSVVPMMNTGFSVLNDMDCGICNKKSYNSSGNWTVDGKSTSKSLYSQNFGNVLGKSVRDSFCLASQLEVCYSNKTEDHYEFFTI
jgi:hypothetical protein